MDFKEYQEKAKATAGYPEIGHPVVYPALGLAGEAGEVVEKVKKLFRDDNAELTLERKEALTKELGDALWYLSQIATELGIAFEDVAAGNIEKLASRADRSVISGDGDDR